YNTHNAHFHTFKRTTHTNSCTFIGKRKCFFQCFLRSHFCRRQSLGSSVVGKYLSVFAHHLQQRTFYACKNWCATTNNPCKCWRFNAVFHSIASHVFEQHRRSKARLHTAIVNHFQ